MKNISNEMIGISALSMLRFAPKVFHLAVWDGPFTKSALHYVSDIMIRAMFWECYSVIKQQNLVADKHLNQSASLLILNLLALTISRIRLNLRNHGFVMLSKCPMFHKHVISLSPLSPLLASFVDEKWEKPTLAITYAVSAMTQKYCYFKNVTLRFLPSARFNIYKYFVTKHAISGIIFGVFFNYI